MVCRKAWNIECDSNNREGRDNLEPHPGKLLIFRNFSHKKITKLCCQTYKKKLIRGKKFKFRAQGCVVGIKSCVVGIKSCVVGLNSKKLENK
jgi:hypothetical protein